MAMQIVIVMFAAMCRRDENELTSDCRNGKVQHEDTELTRSLMICAACPTAIDGLFDSSSLHDSSSPFQGLCWYISSLVGKF